MQAITRDPVELPMPRRGIITDQGDTSHALATQLVHEILHSEGAINWLATSHGHRIVVQNLIGDIDAGRHRGPYGHNARVEVGTITQILKHMLCIGKGGLPDPGRALTAHLGKGMGITIGHPGCHVVAAYPAQRMTALGDTCRDIMRAAGAEMWNPLDDIPRLRQRDLLLLQPANTLIHGLGLIKALDS